MKKILALVCTALLSIFIPLRHASAAGAPIDLSQYQVETLSQALDAEGISYNLKNYSDTDTDKTIIYLFRLNGCVNCKNFLRFVADELLPNYSDKFVVKTFLLARGTAADPATASTNANFALAERLMDFYAIPDANRSNTTPFVFAGKNVASIGALTQGVKDSLVQSIQSGDTYNPIAAINSGATTVTPDPSTPTDPSAPTNPTTPSNPTTPDDRITIFARDNFTIYTDPALDSTYDFRVTPLDRQNVSLTHYDYLSAYDFSFYRNGQVAPMQNGKYTLYIPVSQEYKYYRVAYVKDGKIAETFDTNYANGFISFTTSHLSEYVVYGTNNLVAESNPDTLDQAQIYFAILGASALVIAGSFVAYRRFAKR